MYWSNWPYWLKGGVIAGVITLIFVILWYACVFSNNDLKPGEVESPYVCLGFWVTSPIYPVWLILMAMGQFISRNPEAVISNTALIAPAASIIFWFLIGSLVGLIISLFKKKKLTMW